MGQDDGYTRELSTVVAMSPSWAFELLTDPREIPDWWGPHGCTAPEIKMELPRGGWTDGFGRLSALT